MTSAICTTELGTLTEDMLEQSHELVWEWSHLKDPSKECAIYTESILKRVVEEHTINTDAALPTLDDYNCLLEGWARSKCGIAAAERCEHILQEMEDASYMLPDLESFKTVLMAWREASDQQVLFAPHRAQRILEWMIHLYTHGENRFACPDADCFDTVLQLWAKSGLPEAPMKAEQLVGTMEKFYEETGKSKAQPRTSSFNAVLKAWSKSKDPEAPSRSLAILTFMDKLSQDSDVVAPDTNSFILAVTALKNHAKKDPILADTACRALQFVEGAYMSGMSHLKPTNALFNSVLGCWAKASGSAGSYRRARSVLVRQMKLHEDTGATSPNVFGFTSVLATCAMEPKEKGKAFQVAMQTFQQLRHSDQYGKPNHVTYGTMLKCCARLLPAGSPERKKFVRKIWGMCVQDGCVGDMALRWLREASSSQPTYRKLLGKGHSRSNLPLSWTRNVDAKSGAVRRKQSNHNRKARRAARFAEV
eukprot:CAMPEP_0194036856 /NCGR_PEP_ID=MMETSP0009_2-20130614/9222_1 /TAXON_ID=210454 /ORGANISM="Grammatophora oceanica, Strain CCMP 410" /LENGTH=476 /DNA_ID=CAMNT_0038678781 /DNA_START=158 /DNA_END=1588 /DNA_ORIENTATION=+